MENSLFIKKLLFDLPLQGESAVEALVGLGVWLEFAWAVYIFKVDYRVAYASWRADFVA